MNIFTALAFGVALLTAFAPSSPGQTESVRADADAFSVSADFTDRQVTRNEKITLSFSRAVGEMEGRPAVMVGLADYSSLFNFDGTTLEFVAGPIALPEGESTVTVYLVRPNGQWESVGESQLNVAAAESNEKSESSEKAKKVEFIPKVTINVKGQNQTATFPTESAPERNPFTDVAGQASLTTKVSRRGWNFSNQIDIAGMSFRQEALRFGELQEKAPRIDLSSYLVEISKGRFKFNMGHVSFGSNRHLINGFSSRGLSVTVPLGKRNDIGFAAVNGTSIVGYDNIIGFTRKSHSMFGVTFGHEMFEKRPNGLRFELSLLRGSLLPLSAINEGAITDAEKSYGFGLKVIGSTTGQRVRWEAGITRSRFTNPADQLLEQQTTVTEIPNLWRTARYAEISFDLLKDLKLAGDRKMTLTGTLRHEEIEPLFRSVAAALQADRNQNQFEVTTDISGITVTYGNLRDNDNLGRISSILRTINRRQNAIVAIPLTTIFDPAKPKKWLPSVSYNYEFVHQFGDSFPVNGEFRDPSQIPDQKNHVQTFNLVWQFSERLGLNLSHNRAFQDNRQPGREIADFRSRVTTLALTSKPFSTVDLSFEVSRETQRNFEQPRTDRTLRLGTRMSIQDFIVKNTAISWGISGNLSGDTGNLSDARNAEFDVQWLYKLNIGKKGIKKTEAQFFIRYANRYGDTFDRPAIIRNFNKTQAFNFGLNINVF